MNRIEAVSKDVEDVAKRFLAGEIPTEAECIYDGRNKLYKLTLPSGQAVCVKAFRRLGIIRGLNYALFSRPKSVASYRNARRLLELGFKTPAPLAHAEEMLCGGLRLGRSVYICELLEGAVEIRNWQERADRDEMVAALGVEVARLMQAGVLFRDFSPGNVLIEAGSHYQFTYVDVNRTDFGVHSRRRMMSMFKRINIIPEETARLARAVAPAMGWDTAQTEQKALQILHRFLWLKDDVLHPLKRFFKRLIGKA